MPDEERCEKCDEGFNRGHRYCAFCGRPTGSVPPENNLVSAGRIIGIVLMFICLLVLIFEIYTVFWGFGTIISDIGNYRVGILVLTPTPYILFRVTGPFAQMYYLFLVVATVISFALLLYASRGGIKKVLRKDLSEVDSMPLYSVTTLFAAVVSFNVVYILLVMALGSEPNIPDGGGPVWGDWYDLLNASVWEEVICRILMIGVPMAALGLLAKEKGSWKRLFGRFETDGAATAFIIISAVLFAYAHLSGWDVYKILPSFVAGLALGYLFVKYGVYASIMMHFLIDYMQSFVWVLGDVGGTVFTGLLMFLIVIVGLVFFVWYAVRGTKFIKKMISER